MIVCYISNILRTLLLLFVLLEELLISLSSDKIYNNNLTLERMINTSK
jgi:hypothetical protein